jgi:SAM-dependent methyltransferase
MDLNEVFAIGMKRKILAVLPMEGDIVLNLGAGSQRIEGAISLDLPEWNADKNPIPYGDNTVDHIHMHHFLEHIEDPIAMMLECQRVLKKYGKILITVPWYGSSMAVHDLGHKNLFCADTFSNMLNKKFYNNLLKTGESWKLEINFSVIMGVVDRNICVITQLVKI